MIKTIGRVGIVAHGEYDEFKVYERLDVVEYEGSSYICKRDSIGNLPTNLIYWDLIAAKGDKGEVGSYTPGDNIEIDEFNKISATDTTYNAGTNISIDNENKISAEDTKYSAGNGLQLDQQNEFYIETDAYGAGSFISDVEVTATGLTISYGTPPDENWNATLVTEAQAKDDDDNTAYKWSPKKVWYAISAWFETVTSTFTRGFLAKTTAKDCRDELGLGSAATKNVGTASGNVMEVGTGTRRIATTSGVVAIEYARIGRVTNNTSIAFLISGGGEFGSSQRQNIIITAGSRDGGISATHTELTSTNHIRKVMVYYVSLGGGVFDIWISKAFYQKTINLHVLDSYGEIVDTPVWETALPEGAVLVTPNTYLHTGNIRQTTGSSTDFLMSQKAVTDALNAKSELGVGQTWQDVTSQRTKDTTYTNSTGKPIQIMILYEVGSGNAIFNIGSLSKTTTLSGGSHWFSAIIPNGVTYRIEGGGVTLEAWWELR